MQSQSAPFGTAKTLPELFPQGQEGKKNVQEVITMPKKKFDAYGPDDAPPAPPKIDSVADAAENGTRIDELRQMRKVIARALDNENTAARDLASLSKRQIEISREIDALERQAKEEAEEDAVTDDESWSAEAI